MSPAVQPRLQTTPVDHRSDDLVAIFAACFAESFATHLVGGGTEPEYLPSTASMPIARIIFTRDYFASALHEVAHWCLAGAARRQLPDYGYWYAADGRTAEQQQAFEQVEAKPQALEWLFAEAANFRFRVSADNLGQGLGPSAKFRRAIRAQAREYLVSGLPPRAATFIDALLRHYGGSLSTRTFNRLPD